MDDLFPMPEIPAPVLFNTWKHHAGVLRQRVAKITRAGAAVLRELPQQLLVIGTDLMDLYTGVLTPAEIAGKVISALEADRRLQSESYQAWLDANGGYGVLTFTEDGSRWVLRRGAEPDRHVHVHPARWSPHTLRVRANVLKTAVMLLAHVGVYGGDPRDVARINAVRCQYLGLSPIKELAGDQGLGIVLGILG
jgi:hypothetical protein